jgi:hypothetical protein
MNVVRGTRGKVSIAILTYLFTYNIAQALGWSLCLISLIIAISRGAGPEVVIEEVGRIVRE